VVPKWAQFELAPDAVRARQVLLIALLAGAVGVAYGLSRFWSAAVVWQIARPAPAPGGELAEGRSGRLSLGVVCVAAALVPAFFASRGWSMLTVTISLVVPLAAVAVFVVIERRREEAWRRGQGPQPDRAVLWSVVPAVVWWCAVLLVGGWIAGYDTLPTGTTLVSSAPGGGLDTAVVIGFAEEYLFRGLLFALAIRSGLDRAGFVAVSLSFALWHLPDATSPGHAAVSLAVTFLASQLVFFPLRLRSRGVAGPALLHAANNVAFRMLA
jgi:membrane protease YdiL (CAAX protease family)